MGSRRTDVGYDEDGPERELVWVEHESDRRPFMRGITVHSLMARGVSFEDAFRTADEIYARIAGRGVVQRSELAKLIRSILGPGSLAEHQPPIPLPPRILVGTGPEDFASFSKGRLSQGLLAASINPSDAYEVAREIHQKLLLDGREQVTHSELTRLSHAALLQRFGPHTAERYLVWRQHQNPKKPVIILLGGTAGVGKTSLGLEVAHRLGISRVLSTDAIRNIMRITLSPELMPAIHASSFEAYKSLPLLGQWEDPVVVGFSAQAWVVSVGVRAMLDRAVEENVSMVLDGVSLLPGLIDLDAYRDSAHVIFLAVARLDEDALRSHFKTREAKQKLRSSERYAENFEAILKIQEYFLKLADRYDIPIVDNATIDNSVLLVIRHVVEAVREASGFDASEVL
jgi:2-phosphoglycerate kinase